MKNIKRKSIIAILLVFIMGIMSACGGEKFDAGAYVKSCLDAQFKGEYKEYMEFTESSQKEAEQLYKEGLDELMADYEELALSDELNQKFRDAYADMLKAAKYSVKEAVEEKGEYTVKVAVQPMKCFDTYDDDLEKLQEDFIAEWEEKALNGVEIPSEEVLMEQMAGKVYEDLVQRVQNSEFDKEVIVEVEVKKDKDGVYHVDEEDLEEVVEKAFAM